MRTLKVADPAALYERDFYAWTLAQAAELRRLAHSRSNTALDLSNLIEEVAALGRSERDAVRSHLETIIEHLLKLDHSSATEPRLEWLGTIDRTRDRLEDKLTTALRQKLARHLDRHYRRGRREAARGLLKYGEAQAARSLPISCPYQLDDLLRDGWYSTASVPEELLEP